MTSHLRPGLVNAYGSRGLKRAVYSTFLGGDVVDTATSLLVTPSGIVVVAGRAASANFPVTAGNIVWVTRRAPRKLVSNTLGTTPARSATLGNPSPRKLMPALFIKISRPPC